MNWREKLEVLIDAHDQGNELVRSGFGYNKPLDLSEVNARIVELPFDLPPGTREVLREMYTLVDGMYIAERFVICGLATPWGSYETVREINEDLLATANDHASRAGTTERDPRHGPDLPVRLIFGQDGTSGDFLCLAEHGTTLLVWHDEGYAKQIAPSFDAFLENVCMGPGYLRYSELLFELEPEADDWLRVLTEFGWA